MWPPAVNSGGGKISPAAGTGKFQASAFILTLFRGKMPG
jgi:hypothetical protein